MADDNDEAIARALQEMEDGGTENMFIKETNGISTGKRYSSYPSCKLYHLRQRLADCLLLL